MSEPTKCPPVQMTNDCPKCGAFKVARLDERFVDAFGLPPKFVPDDQGGHIEFNGKIWRPV